jgi:hypothetical protein
MVISRNSVIFLSLLHLSAVRASCAIIEEYLNTRNPHHYTENPGCPLIFKWSSSRRMITCAPAHFETKLDMACALKNKTTGGAGLSEEVTGEKPVQTKKAMTKADKQAEHIARIKRTLIASLIGIGTGALSFYLGGTPDAAGLQKDGFLGLMLVLAGIVIQKHLFKLMGMATEKLGWKEWLYQGFITLAFWFMTWTILLTSIPT